MNAPARSPSRITQRVRTNVATVRLQADERIVQYVDGDSGEIERVAMRQRSG